MSAWQPIETAPKDGTDVDLWAKCWLSKSDQFLYRRFPDCRWVQGDMARMPAQWAGLNKEWYPTHWMPIPHGPKLT